MGAAAERAEEENEEWAGVTPDAARRLVSAAVEAFAERGYHATTTRDIAGRAGMSPAALYIHYKTKEELLYRISGIGHEKALRIMGAAAEAEGSATERLARRRADLRPLARRAPHHRPGHPVRTPGARRGALHRDHRPAPPDRRGVLRQIIQDGADSGEFTCRRRAGHHPRGAVAVRGRRPLVHRGRPAHPRRGRRPLCRPRAAHGGCAGGPDAPRGRPAQVPASWVRS